jgi:UDP-N-acetylglucosamine--N-acetylmuramyl-(pentapeptide) pyrophosphoryl-undecaprenol N-acetylglucosamine transferase
MRGFFFKPRARTYLFLPINGAGLGHLTRSLAIARRLKREQPDAEIVFLTTSIGVTLVHREGFACHHVTPAALLNVGAIQWNSLFFKSLRNALDIHKPHCLVFDGTIPYLGLQRVMHSYRRIRYVWIKRGLYKEGTDIKRLTSLSRGFKAIISPGELGAEVAEAVAGSGIYPVEPIALLDTSDLLEKAVARQLLRLASAEPCVYVQLGAGNINGIADAQDRIIAVLKSKGIQVVLGQSPIALNPKPDLRADSVIVDYPNSKYFSAFDFAVLAGGYNSVCEAVMLGLPAIFFPNTQTGADDQLKRVQNACAFGRYEVMVEFNEDQFEQIVDKLLENLRSAKSLEQRNGAASAAKLLAQV